MTETISREADPKIYEIGYLLVSSIPLDKVTETVTLLKDVLSKKGASFIAEEAPELRPLAYTMVKKIGSQNHRFDQAYFGWFKFELPSGDIEAIKKSFELNKDMLRMLLINTVKENTYLGKKAPAVLVKGEEAVAEGVPVVDAVVATPATIEEMDKSIDDMVKGA